MVKARKIVTLRKFDGEPKLSDFKIIEEELPPLKDGQFLSEALWLSPEPYTRAYISLSDESSVKGKVVLGSTVSRVVESKAPEYPKGSYIVGHFGWQDKTIFDTQAPYDAVFPKPYVLPDFGSVSLSHAVGALGMPGVTANLSFVPYYNGKPGNTIVVSGAAGAVGTVVGQIAKMKGSRVIGFAGSDDKVRRLKQELGFDFAYNYKKVTVEDALAEAAPNGVDCYFDNVGGIFSNEVMARMNKRGQVFVCGVIAGYNTGFDKFLVPAPQLHILSNELRVQGFMVFEHFPKWFDAIKENLKWIQEGKLIPKETITEGFENAPKAFIGMLRGENFGKAVVKV